jgi:hypothetical protein
MSKTRLPTAIRDFVEGLTTIPVAELWKVDKKELQSPYGSWWYRAVACILLSGRVRPKYGGGPNMTDVDRLGKEANFNQYLTEQVAKFLVAADVIKDPITGPYVEGPNINTFWEHDAERLPKITRHAILNHVDRRTGYRPKRIEEIGKAHLVEFLTLFFAGFDGRAVVESQLGDVMVGFSRLPIDDLVPLAQELGLPKSAVDPDGWGGWLTEEKRRKALIEALYIAEWAYYDKKEQTGWFLASPTGMGMLGLETPPPPPKLDKTLKAMPDLSIVAGAGLARETLIPLFRHCEITKIKEVSEFRLDPKRLALEPAGATPGKELRKALRTLEPLPPTIAELLGTKSKLGGEVAMAYCSAIVKPENEAVLKAIRQHPKLKGYIAPHSPPGYLIIKENSDPDNFIWRCRELGFEVKPL